MINLIKGAQADVAQSVLGTVKDYYPQIYKNGLKAGCNIYRKYQKTFPLNPLPRMYGERICAIAETPFPPPPPPLDNRGLCDTKYHVFCTYISKQATNCNMLAYARTSGAFFGNQIDSYTPILDDSNRWALRAKNGTFVLFRPISKRAYDSKDLADSNVGVIVFRASETACINVTSPEYGHTLQVMDIIRVDGLPDNCGDPNANEVPDPPIDDKDFNQKITIYNYDPNGNIESSKEFDLIIPTLDIKPNFNFKFDLGGVKFNINMGGLYIKGDEIDVNNITKNIKNELEAYFDGIETNLNTNFTGIKNELELNVKPTLEKIKNEIELNLSPTVNQISSEIIIDLQIEINALKNEIKLVINNNKAELSNLLGLEFDTIENKLDFEIIPTLKELELDINLLDDLINSIEEKIYRYGNSCKFTRKVFNPDDYSPEDIEESLEGVEEEEKKRTDIEWVLLTITKYPPGGKTLLMGNEDDNTYFAGYFSWILNNGVEDYRLEEIPIRKSKMAFRSPRDVQGYRFYTVNRAAIKSTIYYQP